MKKILPLLLLLIGSGVGVGAGAYLRPEVDEAPKTTKDEQNDKTEKSEDAHGKKDEPTGELEYAKLSNQFVVPIIRDRVVVSLVVLSLSLEVSAGSKERIYKKEPKLRDSFLQVMFDHANVGGFDGSFTDATMLKQLRTALGEVARRDLGPEAIKDVLIVEIARQDY